MVEGLNLAHFRSRFFNLIREYFSHKGFLEVDTPILLPSPLPEAHIDPIYAEKGYLQPSPELSMKILLGMGFSNIFQIAKCFRKGEAGTSHLEEFWMLEWYEKGDYKVIMTRLEDLILHLTNLLYGSKSLTYDGIEVDLRTPWPRIDFTSFFLEKTGLSPREAIFRGVFEEILVHQVESCLPKNRPCFLVDYPVEVASFSKSNEAGGTAQRFELYIGGLELANGFSELTDPLEQAKRFEEENKKRVSMGKAPFRVSKAFMNALPKIPPTGGVAVGLDRVLMLFLSKKDIKEVQVLHFDNLI